jgi:hypothetical protein
MLYVFTALETKFLSLEHRPEQASGQVTLRQQQPVIPGVLDQSTTGFHQSLLPGQDTKTQSEIRG